VFSPRDATACPHTNKRLLRRWLRIWLPNPAATMYLSESGTSVHPDEIQPAAGLSFANCSKFARRRKRRRSVRAPESNHALRNREEAGDSIAHASLACPAVSLFRAKVRVVSTLPRRCHQRGIRYTTFHFTSRLRIVSNGGPMSGDCAGKINCRELDGGMTEIR
jgi:hypothetical protein